MRRLLLIVVMLLSGGNAGLAQVSTLGTTAMGLPSTPGTMLSSPLNGPSPFSAVTQPGTPDTTLAPVPLASDPTTPGTVVVCSTPSGQIAPATPTVTSTFTDVTGGTTPSTPATPPGTISVPGVVSTTGTTPPASAPGGSSSTVCSSTPGGPPTNGAALPLSTLPPIRRPARFSPAYPTLAAPVSIRPAGQEDLTTSRFAPRQFDAHQDRLPA
jgi:hypothetical protein